MLDAVKGAKLDPKRGAVRVLGCGCSDHPVGVGFYTSAQNDAGRFVALSGPYQTHGEALGKVAEDRDWTHDVLGDPRAPWYAYGTMSALVGTVKVARQ